MAKINVLGTEITYYQYEENDFISPEFEGIESHAGLNRFVLSVKQWVEKTNSKGIIARAGGELMKNQKNLKSQIVTSSRGRRSDD